MFRKSTFSSFVLCRASVFAALLFALIPASAIANDPFAANAKPSSFQCTSTSQGVQLTWTNPVEYDFLIVLRDGNPLATLAGTSTSYVDNDSFSPGHHTYSVRGQFEGNEFETTGRRSFLLGGATDLIWAPAATHAGPTRSATALFKALRDNRRTPVVVSVLPAELPPLQAIWVTLGTYPYNHTLSEAEGAKLLRFVNSSSQRALYIEGGDIWVDDPRTTLQSAFPLEGVDGGREDVSWVVASAQSCNVAGETAYDGETVSIDRLRATDAGTSLWKDAAGSVDFAVVGRTSIGSFVLGSSLEFGGLAPVSGDLELVMANYLGCMGQSAPSSGVAGTFGAPAPGGGGGAIPGGGGTPPTATVQSGTATSNGNGTLTISITSVDPARAFLLFQSRHNSNRPVGSMIRGRIANGTTLEFTRVTNETSPMVIQWYVVEYSSGINVQRGSSSQASLDTTIPITPLASANQAFVTWSKTPTSTDVSWGANDPVLVEIPSPPATPDELLLQADGTGSAHVIWWQVVEFTDPTLANVQRGSLSLTGSTTQVDATLSAVDVNSSFVLAGLRHPGSGSDIGERMIRARLLNSTTARFDRSLTGDNISEIRWQVVELTDGSTVQSGVRNLSSGVSQATVSINSVDLTRATAFSGVQPACGQSMGRTDYASDDVAGVCSLTMALSSSQITMNRTSTAAATNVGWFVVEWGAAELPPTLTSVTPSQGSPLGGDTVTLGGTEFTSATTVTFDGTAATVTFVNDTTLSVVTPAHAPGAVDVVVTNAAGSDTLTNGFTYLSPPDLVSLSPGNGTPLGGTSVTLTGTDFTASTSVTFDGIAASTTFVNATTLTAVTPAHAPGAVDVVVTNANGSDTLAGGFSYDSPPDLVSLSPANGTPLGGDTITLTGTNFTASTSVTFDGIAASTTFVSATTLTAVTPAHAPGAVDVVVTNANGSDTLAGAFSYDSPPDLVSLSPTNGTPLGGDTVTLTGTNFTASTTVTFDGTAASVTFVSATTLTATSPAHAPGVVDVAVSNANGSDTLANAFTYDTPPDIVSLSPANGTPLGGDSITVVGSSFTSATTVTFDGIAATSVTFLSASALTAVTPAHAPGVVDVIVSNENGSDTLTSAFTYDSPPDLVSLSPVSGTPLGGDVVTLTGANFTASTSVTFDGQAATSITFVNSTTITAETPAHAPGAVDVAVSNLNGSDTLSGGFSYESPPDLVSLSPSSGTPLGGDTVTLTGVAFTPSTTVTFDATSASVTFVNATTLTVITPAHAPGVVDVVVSNGNGSDTLSNAFTYNEPPDLVSLAPTSGTPLGGDTITLTGTAFTASTTVTFDGAAAAVTFVNATTLSVVSPAHAPGTVDVVVANGNGSDTLSSAFTYDSPPDLVSLSPTNGTPLGGTSVTLTGTAFTSGTTVSFDGTSLAVTFVNSTTLTVTTVAHAPGTVDVVVANQNGSDTLAGAFTFDPPPSLTSLSPTNGTPLGGDLVTLTGTGFTATTSVTFDGTNASVTFVSTTTLNATTPAHAPGTVDVVVSNENGSDTLSNSFTYDTPPDLVSLTPTNGTPLGGTTVTLTGTSFTSADTVTFDGIAATVTFVSPTTLTAVTPAHAPGAVDVVVANGNGADTLAGAFTYDAAPDLVSVTPVSGSPLGGDSVTLSGTGFTASTTVTFDGGAAASVAFVNATTLTAVTPAHAPGTVDVAVSNENGGDTLVGAFTYETPPDLVSISPTNGTPLGGDTVTLTGTDFTSSTTVSFDGLAAATTFVNATTLSVVTPAHAPGVVDVTVTDPNGTDTLAGAFTYDAPPTLASLSPGNGTPLGGTSVTISGSNFTAATTASFDGSPASVTFFSSSVLFAVTPAHAPGTVDVEVANVNGADTLVGAFTYDSPPDLVSITPTTGSPLGGDTVTLTGSAFTATTTVSFDGVDLGVTFVNSTTLTVVTAAHAPGTVDVAVANVNGADTLSSAYTFETPPDLVSISPTNGTPLGGTAVTLSGTGFTASTTVTFDGFAAAVTFVNATTLTAVTPAHAPGTVDVVVSNSNGTDTLSSAFTYDSPPDLVSVSPTNGTPLGGTSVTLTGTGFTASTTVTFDGGAAPVTFVSSTTLNAVAPAHAPGVVDVVVSNVNGTDTLANAFTYDVAPDLVSLSPVSGSPLGGDTVTLTGTGFTSSTSVTFDGIAAASVTFGSATTLTAVSPAHVPGTVDVAVSNANGSDTLTGGYTYETPPDLVSLSPTNGSPLGGTTVTLSGTNFTANTAVTFDGLAATVTFVNSTTLTAGTPAHAPGAVDVAVNDPNGTDTLAGAFTYDAPPVLASIAPTNGTPLGGTALTLTGTGFTSGTTVMIDGTSVAVSFVNSTTLTATTQAHAPGTVDVVVSNVNGTSTLANAFTFDGPPVLTSVTPANGSPVGGQTVTLSGSNFTAGTSVTFGGVAAASVTFVDAATIDVVTPASAPGTVDVAVSNVNGSDTLVGGFTFDNGPVLSSLSPTSGSPLGGTSVTISGSSLTASTSVTFDGIAAASVVFVNSTTLTAVTPAHAPGTVDVSVANVNGSSTLASSFTFETGPDLVSIAPTSGSPLGGDTVTLTGTDFTAGTTVTFGAAAAASISFVNATTLSVVTPANAPGTVDVAVANLNGSDTLVGAFTYDAPPTIVSVSPVSGTPLGGDLVTVTGSNFTASTSVSFDGLSAASVSFVNATMLTAVTPAHAPGAVDVTVANANGSASLSGGFTYDAPPTLSSVSPTSGSPLGGDTITLTGVNFANPVTVEFDGLPALSVSFVNSTTITAVTPAHAPGSVDVTVSTVNGADTLTSGFTYDSPPVLSSLSPANGSPLGGTTVVLSGSNFTADSTVSFDGLAAAVTFVSSSTLNAVTPAHAAGAVDVAVGNANGVSTLTGAYVYDEAPTLTSVAPTNGTPLGGDSVTITGTGFVAGTMITFDGVAAGVVIVNSTTITATSPAHAPGTVDVAVSNVNGSATLAGAFTYDGPPSLASVNPTNGSPLGGTTVTLTGAGFTGGTSVSFDGAAASSVVFVNATTLTAVAPAHAPGTVDVSVANVNGADSLASAFTYDAAPALTSIAPTSGSPLGGDTVTLTGTGFTAGTGVTIDGVAASAVSFVNATTLTAVTPAHAPGTVDVAVSNVNGTATLASAFTYDNPPAITSLTPSNGTPLGGDSVTISGSSFTAGTDVQFDGIAAASVSFVNATTLTAVTPAHAPGTVDVSVSNENGADTLSSGFTFDSPPTLSSLSPTQGSPLGGDTVTITGANFSNPVTVEFDGIAALSVSFVNSTTVTVVTPAHAPGTVDVSLTTVNGSDTLANAFSYDGPPVLTSVAPGNGSPLGGTSVTLTGTNFTPGIAVTFDGVAAVSVNFVNAAMLDVVSPAHAPGVVDVAVTNANGSSTLAGAFVYDAPPTLVSLSPTNGSPLGGDSITLTGSGFVTGTTVEFDGLAAVVSIVNATTLIATTPAHAPATVSVSVSNVNGTDTLAGAFTYDVPPTLSSLTPTSGSPLGGTVVTLTGSGFTAASTVTFDGLAAGVSFVNSTTLTATTPAHAAGAVDVTVSTVNGSDTLVGAYTYDVSPDLVSLSPASGTPLGGDSITLTGTGFTAATAVTFDGVAAATTFVSDTSLIAVTPPHAPAIVDVSVSNVNGADTLASAFEYEMPPTITSISPMAGTPLGGDVITVTGSNFTASSMVSFDGLPAASMSFLNATTLTAVTPAHAPGTVDVTVSNANGSDTLVGSFTYEEAPVLTSITPTSGSPLGGDTVTLTGSGFTASMAVTFDGIASAAVSFVNATTVTADAPAHAPGAVDVAVSNSNGSDQLVGAYTYETPPTITGLSPSNGSPLGGDTVTITGTAFTGTTTVTFDGSPAASVSLVDSVTLTAVTPAHAPGTIDVVVANANGSDTLTGAFTFETPPVLTSIAPISGSPLGGETVTLTGTDFTATTSVTIDGVSVAPTFVSSTSLTVVTPAHAPGTVDVAVSNENGSSTLSNAFTYDGPPVLTGVSPNSGSPLGGETVTVSGSNFVAGTTVEFDGVAAASVVLLDAATLEVVTPAHAPGTVDVSVSNVNGTATLTGGFTYDDPPVLTLVNPLNGSPLGGETVALTGTGFTATTTATFDGLSAVVTFVSDTMLTAVTPAHAPGPVDVTLSNENGTSTLAGGFTYDEPPVITSIVPASGSPLGGDSVTITGTNLGFGVAVTFDGVPAVSVGVVGLTTITAVTPPHAPGPVDVVVSSVNGVSTLVNGFTYENPPVLTSVAPASGSPLGGDTLTLTGSGFTATTTVEIDGVAVAPVTFVDSMTLTAVSPAHAPGAVDVVVANENGASTLSNGFTYGAGPSLTSVTPDVGFTVGGDTVTLSGTGFTATTSVTFDGLAATSITFVDAMTLTADTPAHGLGIVDVVVSNANGTSTLVGGFTYVGPAPILTSLSPSNGSPLGGDTITLTGDNFTASTTVEFDGVASPMVTLVDPMTLTALTPPHVSGLISVTVSNRSGSDTLLDSFTYDLPPLLTSISPSTGSPLGGEMVTLIGEDFTADAVVEFDGVMATAVTLVDSNTLTAITPAHPEGTVDVTVSNVNGVATLVSAFTYNLAPLLSAVAPAVGDPLGGDTVAVTGANFTGTTAVEFDGTPAPVVIFVDSGTLTVVTPAHAAGVVDVTVINENGSDTLVGGFTYASGLVLSGAAPDRGPVAGGTTVVLTGIGFTATDTVTFDGIAASSFTFIDSETIEVTTPAHAAGPVDVTLTGVGGSTTLVEGFTYLDAPVLTAVSPAAGDVNGGQAVTLVGSNLSVLGDVGVLFDGVPAAVVSVTGEASIIVTTPMGAGVGFVDVTVTTSGGSATLMGAYEYLDGLFMRGDGNSDGSTNVADTVFVVTYLFANGAAPICEDAADFNDDGLIDLSDPIFLLFYIFNGGPQPLPPFPAPGSDPTPDSLTCNL